ncbi:hypothetical protein [Streptomyces katrae]|uniref:Uncharacterized protein n=1 Tax=Streptomyces katrae TaxID=68223 RepID=A0A0F4JVV8_9ACTN|nr:hypothetical protein [Streptomyces katrae]KJY37106.1 hypothetical protein VR44_06580 [Streptomyces katrae]
MSDTTALYTFLNALLGVRVSGGCTQCAATMVCTSKGYGHYFIQTTHQEGCPVYASESSPPYYY